MALSQVGLERLNTATTKKIGTSKNLIINGAMQVAQRGTSSTSTGMNTVDRWSHDFTGTDEAPTFERAAVTTGGAYDSGFRTCLKATNGNQTSGAGAGDFIFFRQRIEAQDVATSGWNYVSASSDITVSFWAKSSVAQTFQVELNSVDGTRRIFAFEFTISSTNTWTKITKTIPGNSGLQFDNDNGNGLELVIFLFLGTNSTASGGSLDAWGNYSDRNNIRKDMASTWYTTNNATFELTGVQIEVGSVATDFEHRSFADELLRCYRYFQILSSNTSGGLNAHSRYPILGNATNGAIWYAYHKATMRVKPSLVKSGITASTMDIFNYSTSGTATFNNMVMAEGDENHSQIVCSTTNNFAIAQIGSWRWSNNADCYFAVNSEL